jgi:glyoxalase family protein
MAIDQRTTRKLSGIHHVTAIAGDPQRNVDFYTGLLGLRLVKLTVNFDDPETYHLYYGDGVGHPGTILTFFPWPGGMRGRPGTGQLTMTSFSVPEGAMGFWVERLKDRRILFDGPSHTGADGEEALSFFDPDGLGLELVAHPGAEERSGWEDGPVPHEHAIRGFHRVTLMEEGYERTAALMTENLGFRLTGENADRFRYQIGDGGPGAIVDVKCRPVAPRGIVSVGTVHHVAWRTPDDEQQRGWREDLVSAGLNVTPVMDRQYFHSIYFREPGGVLFEIATDPPGFMVDETQEQLGRSLKLPPWLEPMRQHLQHALPQVHLSEATTNRARAAP